MLSIYIIICAKRRRYQFLQGQKLAALQFTAILALFSLFPLCVVTHNSIHTWQSKNNTAVQYRTMRQQSVHILLLTAHYLRVIWHISPIFFFLYDAPVSGEKKLFLSVVPSITFCASAVWYTKTICQKIAQIIITRAWLAHYQKRGACCFIFIPALDNDLPWRRIRIKVSTFFVFILPVN